MAPTQRETFSVSTVGAGSPDYAQPVTELPTSRTLTVKYPETEVAGKRYDDFTKIDVTSSETEYEIGTNANAARTDSWPSGTVSKEIAFYATKACYIRFNYDDAVQHEIPEGIVIRFFRRTQSFYVTRLTEDGTLYAWIEG